MSGQKPDLSINIKPAGSKEKADRRYILSGWVNDQGRLSSLRFDRGVKAMKIQFDDGEVVTIARDKDGKVTSHYIDCFLRDGTYGADAGDKRGGYNAKDQAFGGNDGGDNFEDSSFDFGSE